MNNLIRTKVDNFELKNALTLDYIEKNNIQSNLIKMEEIFKNLSKIDLDMRKKELFLNGVNLTFKLDDGLYNIYSNDDYIGTGIVKNKLLKRDIVING